MVIAPPVYDMGENTHDTGDGGLERYNPYEPAEQLPVNGPIAIGGQMRVEDVAMGRLEDGDGDVLIDVDMSDGGVVRLVFDGDRAEAFQKMLKNTLSEEVSEA